MAISDFFKIYNAALICKVNYGMMSTVSHRNHLKKTNCTHCSISAGKLNKVIFPLQHFFRDILLEQVLGSAASNADRCALALFDLPGDVPIRGIPPFVGP